VTEDQNAYPVAYCAPGKRLAAAFTLMVKGEQVARIVEHPWLEGAEGVYVVAEDPLDLIRQLPVRYEFPAPETRPCISRDWAYGALVNRPSPGFHPAVPITGC
jgi:hypothetical protein